jgi:hypothetical protein
MQRVSRTSFFFLIIDLAQGEYIIKHYHLDDTIWTPKKAYLVRGALFFFWVSRAWDKYRGMRIAPVSYIFGKLAYQAPGLYP